MGVRARINELRRNHDGIAREANAAFHDGLNIQLLRNLRNWRRCIRVLKHGRSSDDVERFYRDARALELLEGTREIQKNTIARYLMGKLG